MIVLDASALVELLLNTSTGKQIARRIEDPQLTLHAPHLVDLEVANVLRRYVLKGQVTKGRATFALEQLTLLDLTRYEHPALLPRIWALRDNLTAYDAAYVALAEALGAVLLTTDHRIQLAPGPAAEIETFRPTES